MAQKVGEGYVEIETRLDEDNFVRASRGMAQRAALAFGKDYNDNLTRSLRNADQQFDVHINRQISSFQALEKQRVASAEASARRISALQNEIASATDRDRRLSDAYAKEGQRAAAAFEKEQNASFDRVIASYRKGLVSLGDDTRSSFNRVGRDVDVDVDRHSNRWGRTIALNLERGFEGLISIMPARLESVFTRTGPILGGILIGGLAAGLAIGLPAIGAMISGAVFATAGLGAAAAAAIVGAVNDPRVSDAANRLGTRFKDLVINDPSVQNLGQVLADQLDKVTAALSRWAPHFQSILQAGASFLGPITDVFIKAFDRIIPVLDRLVNSPFVKALMEVVKLGIAEIFEAFAISIERFLDDENAMEGATLGLRDAFDLLASAIKTTFDIMRNLSAVWADLNRDPDGPGPQLSTLNAIRDAWREIKMVLDDVANIFKFLDKFSLKNLLSVSDTSGTGQGGAAGAIESVANGIRKLKDLYRELSEAVQSAWQGIVAGWSAVANFFTSTIPAWGSTILGIWTGIWNGFVGVISSVWNAIFSIVTGVITSIANFLAPAVKLITDIVAAAWGIIEAITLIQWKLIQVTIEFVMGIISAVIGFFLNLIQTVWNAVWGAISAFFVAVWQGIWNFIGPFVTMIGSFLAGWLDSTSNTWNSVWTAISNFFVSIWNGIWNFLVSIWTTIWGYLQTGWDLLTRGWDALWSGMINILSTSWNIIKDGVVAGINAVIGVLNSGIDLINKVLEKLGIDFRVSKIDLVGGSGPVLSDNRTSVRGNAFGGRIEGPGSDTSDSILRRLSNDEYVIRAKSAKKLGYQNLDYLNRTGQWGMAAGGRVDASNNGLLEQHRNHLHVAMDAGFQAVIAAAAASGLPFNVGSTVRPGSRGSSGNLDWHHYGKAVDFMGYDQDALAAYFEQLPGVIEEIHRTASRDYAIFGKGKSIGSILNEFMAKGIDWIMEHMLNPIVGQIQNQLPNSVPGAIGKGTIAGTITGLRKKVEEAISKAKEAAAPSGGGGGGGAAQWSGVASQALAMLGLPGSWLGPLLTLIGRESGGNPNAINRTDMNALRGDPSRGLMQTIGSTFNAYKLPGYDNIFAPLDNILAGLRYIVARYGSIFNVQQAVGATPHGYDDGGYLPPGLSMTYNGTGHPEPVLTSSQWDAMNTNNITVYVDGVEAASRVVVDRNNTSIVQAIRRGKRV